MTPLAVPLMELPATSTALLELLEVLPVLLRALPLALLAPSSPKFLAPFLVCLIRRNISL